MLKRYIAPWTLLLCFFSLPWLNTAEAKTLNLVEAQIIIQKKRARLQKAYDTSSSANQKKRRQIADKLLRQARLLISKSRYGEAKEVLEEAIAFYPANTNLHYYYGVSLYHLKRLSYALVVFSLLEEEAVDLSAIYYYQGMIYLKKRKKDLARKKFNYAIDEGGALYSSTASLYLGLMAMEKNKYSEAQKHFQFVLDTSHNNPKLDEQAEYYIERVQEEQWAFEQGQKHWSYGFTLGAGYDENVLNVAANNVATDLEAFRLFYGASGSYRFFYEPKSSLEAKLSVFDVYSVDKDFEGTADIQSADPLQITLSLPYTRQVDSLGKGARFVVTPSYQSLFMQDGSGSSSRDRVFDSYALSLSLQRSESARWLSTYQLDLGQDVSHIATADAEDDQSALRYNLLYSGTLLLGKDFKRSIFFDLFYGLTDAKGANNSFERWLLSAGYSYPLNSHWSNYIRGECFQMDFSDSSPLRKDDSYTIGVGFQRSAQRTSNFSVELSYTDNQSNVEFFDFNKMALIAMWTFNSEYF